MLIQTVDFKVITDGRGSLISLEGGSADVPFDIQRVYYIFGVGQGVVRGAHAHKRTSACVRWWCACPAAAAWCWITVWG